MSSTALQVNATTGNGATLFVSLKTQFFSKTMKARAKIGFVRAFAQGPAWDGGFGSGSV